MSTTTALVQGSESLATSMPLFRLSMAQSIEDLRACQRLRYLVFNCELGEGLTHSDRSGLDCDRFDAICDHLMVHGTRTGRLAGTYRMQRGCRAKTNLGYYSEELFDLRPFEGIRGEVLELGRACVHEDYRKTSALVMLWKGIATYAALCKARYLIGCSSIASQDEDEGVALYAALREKYLVEPPLRTAPHANCRCRPTGEAIAVPSIPRLFRAYLETSARLCGPPAIDRAFRTIDFLTLLDLQAIPARVRNRFF